MRCAAARSQPHLCSRPVECRQAVAVLLSKIARLCICASKHDYGEAFSICKYQAAIARWLQAPHVKASDMPLPVAALLLAPAVRAACRIPVSLRGCQTVFCKGPQLSDNVQVFQNGTAFSCDHRSAAASTTADDKCKLQAASQPLPHDALLAAQQPAARGATRCCYRPKPVCPAIKTSPLGVRRAGLFGVPRISLPLLHVPLLALLLVVPLPPRLLRRVLLRPLLQSARTKRKDQH